MVPLKNASGQPLQDNQTCGWRGYFFVKITFAPFKMFSSERLHIHFHGRKKKKMASGDRAWERLSFHTPVSMPRSHTKQSLLAPVLPSQGRPNLAGPLFRRCFFLVVFGRVVYFDKSQVLTGPWDSRVAVRCVLSRSFEEKLRKKLAVFRPDCSLMCLVLFNSRNLET